MFEGDLPLYFSFSIFGLNPSLEIRGYKYKIGLNNVWLRKLLGLGC